MKLTFTHAELIALCDAAQAIVPHVVPADVALVSAILKLEAYKAAAPGATPSAAVTVAPGPAFPVPNDLDFDRDLSIRVTPNTLFPPPTEEDWFSGRGRE